MAILPQSILSQAVSTNTHTINKGITGYDALQIGGGTPFGTIIAGMSPSQAAFSLNALNYSIGASAALTSSSTAGQVASAFNGLLKSLIEQGIIKSA